MATMMLHTGTPTTQDWETLTKEVRLGVGGERRAATVHRSNLSCRTLQALRGGRKKNSVAAVAEKSCGRATQSKVGSLASTGALTAFSEREVLALKDSKCPVTLISHRVLRVVSMRAHSTNWKAPAPVYSRIYQELSNGMLAYHAAYKMKEVVASSCRLFAQRVFFVALTSQELRVLCSLAGPGALWVCSAERDLVAVVHVPLAPCHRLLFYHRLDVRGDGDRHYRRLCCHVARSQRNGARACVHFFAQPSSAAHSASTRELRARNVGGHRLLPLSASPFVHLQEDPFGTEANHLDLREFHSTFIGSLRDRTVHMPEDLWVRIGPILQTRSLPEAHCVMLCPFADRPIGQLGRPFKQGRACAELASVELAWRHRGQATHGAQHR